MAPSRALGHGSECQGGSCVPPGHGSALVRMGFRPHLAGFGLRRRRFCTSPGRWHLPFQLPSPWPDKDGPARAKMSRSTCRVRAIAWLGFQLPALSSPHPHLASNPSHKVSLPASPPLTPFLYKIYSPVHSVPVPFTLLSTHHPLPQLKT